MGWVAENWFWILLLVAWIVFMLRIDEEVESLSHDRKTENQQSQTTAQSLRNRLLGPVRRSGAKVTKLVRAPVRRFRNSRDGRRGDVRPFPKVRRNTDPG